MSGWGMIAVVSGVAAVGLGVGPVRRPDRRVDLRRTTVVCVALVGGGLLAGLLSAHEVTGRRVALAVVVGACAVGARTMWLRLRRRRLEDAGQARVLDFCHLVAAELAAGQPPGTALERAAAEWSQLDPVAAVLRMGGDVPTALRSASASPGQQDLVLAAAAWQVAHQTGGGLTAAMSRVAAGLRAGQATRRVVQAELASARATARLMAGLPVLALLMGSGIGGDPLGFLFGSTWGLGCLGAGLAFGFAGLWWIEAIADTVARGGP
jgi:tight adherence protein B